MTVNSNGGEGFPLHHTIAVPVLNNLLTRSEIISVRLWYGYKIKM